jgi:hypothetical protein
MDMVRTRIPQLNPNLALIFAPFSPPGKTAGAKAVATCRHPRSKNPLRNAAA